MDPNGRWSPKDTWGFPQSWGDPNSWTVYFMGNPNQKWMMTGPTITPVAWATGPPQRLEQPDWGHSVAQASSPVAAGILRFFWGLQI